MENSKQKQYSIRQIKERIFLGTAYLCAALAVLPLFLLLSYVCIRGITSLNLSFFTHLPAPVGESGGGIGNAIIGTAMVLLLGSMLSLPVGILSGIWLAQWGNNKWAFWARYSVDILAGIPTIVLGIFAYVLIVLPFKHFSAFAGGFALALIMVPYITRTTETMIKMMPITLRESGLALGLPEWKVSLFVVFRSAWNGIFTGIMLAASRAAGETAPLLFTAFNSLYWNINPAQPMATMTVQIYNYAISPYDEWNRMAWAGSLVLIMIVLSVTLVVRKFSKRVTYG